MASRAPEPQAGTHQDAWHQQVMSPRMGFHPKGSAAEPSYGSVAGGSLEAGRQAGRALLPNGVDPVRQGQVAGSADPAPVRGREDAPIAQRRDLGAQDAALADGPSAGTGDGAGSRGATGPGATYDGTCTHTQQTSEAAPAIPPAAEPQPQTAEPSRLQLQQAAQQLAEQRSAVLQAVQERAHRAVDEQASNPFAPTQPPPSILEEHRAASWSWTRVSEVLHRGVVGPVLERMGGARFVASPSNYEHAEPAAWGTPNSATPAQSPLISPEVRSAMRVWSRRPSLLNPAPLTQDGSSSDGFPQEVVVEEVRRQVQAALQGQTQQMNALEG